MKDNLAYLLWAMFRIKSKWLCKHNYHFYMLTIDVIRKEKRTDTKNGFKIDYECDWKTYRKCNTCGKILNEEEYERYLVE